MPRKPDTPCTGCGKLLWSGRTSRPAAERRCRDCGWSKIPDRQQYMREYREKRKQEKSI